MGAANTTRKTEKNTHHGHGIRYARSSQGIKQEALAVDMGITQALVSMYESKKVIDDNMIAKFAEALRISPDFIKEFEEAPLTLIVENNTFEKGSVGNIAPYSDINNENFGNTYNPIEEILKLNQEKQMLYERMLALEQEKIALLEKLLNEKK